MVLHAFWILVLSLAGSTPSQEQVVKIEFESARLSRARCLGYDLIHLEGAAQTSRPGAPSLPVKQVDVALPADAVDVELRVLETDYRALSGSFRLLPCSEPRVLGRKESKAVEEDPAIYEKDERYPARAAKVVGEWDLNGQRFVTLALHPVDHNPVTGETRFCQSMTVTLTWKQGTPDAAPASEAEAEYVVISPDHWAEDWEELLRWKTRKGVPAQVVTLSWIEAQFTGADLQEKIRAFISQSGARWFLLGGDTSLVPTRKTSVLGDNIPNDTYYADFDGDRKVEAFVGRASADNSIERETFIAKTLSYEKAPPAGFGSSAFFLGFDLDPQTPAETLKQAITSLYVDATLSLTTEYDSEPGAHKAECLALLDQGFNLINHADHSDYNSMGTGSFRHDEHLTIQDIYSLTNAGRAGVIKSIGCHAASFDKNDCIAEHLCKAPGGGATAFVGNSRSGWYTLGSMSTYSALYDRLFFKSLLEDQVHHAGETLAACKNAYYPSDDYYRYIFLELNLLGDPELPLWTGEPQGIEATHPALIQGGGQLFTVHATSQGAPLEGASICLWKGEEVYARGFSDANGEWIADIHPLTPGDLLVTVTAKNHKPYEGDAEVLAQGPEPMITSISPRFGLEAGGDLLSIEGTGFTPGLPMSVTVDGNPATDVQVSSSTALTCLVPPGVNGFVSVEVTNLFGTALLEEGYRYFPTGGPPFNGTDIPVNPVHAGQTVTLIASGQPSYPCLVFLSLEPGPTPTPWGDMGLGTPVYFLFSFALNAQGYSLASFLVPDIGPLDFHVHLLGAEGNATPRWSYGGNGLTGAGEMDWRIE